MKTGRGRASAPLQGVKVVELARILAGPWAGQLFADLGAQVIKVESPAGDDTRGWGPPFVTYADGSEDAAYFHAANRGKDSVVADFATAEGQAKVLELLQDADVLIENFKVGGLVKFGLDYQTLKQRYPKLIYCSITGFGQDGPYSQRAGYDFIIQAMSGIMDVTGESDGPPQKIGVAYADILTGLYAAIGIQAALIQRQATGLGQHIDMALFDVMVGTLANQALNCLVSGESPHRIGNAHPNIAPYQSFQCKDGWIVVAVGNDQQFQRFAELIDIQLLEEWRTNKGRVEDRHALAAAISRRLSHWDCARLLLALEENGIPGGPINSISEALSDPQIMYRRMITEHIADDGTALPGLRCPIVFSDAELAEGKGAPRRGRQ
ncbi:CoA transferase [Pacificimonas sp. WHA3]|uniref:CoA transferase n=1 Tax=Pacificimonas pallii TaxID=2827236 RepID=A0ABS6SAD5_9SPHN|nr:CaiB/BaiF CoA-transferase family protein [Pacificimonas pallii]MBV7255289.1 CoA transferase [Pacificimonas pallii]